MSEHFKDGLNQQVQAMSKHGIPSETQRFLAFNLHEDEFAIPLLSVREVGAMPEVTRVPHSSPYFLGIMNLRGQVISLFDLRLKLNMKAENTAETAVIICDLNPLCFGIVVNSVNRVLTLSPNEIDAKPDVDSKHRNDYITGVTRKDNRLILLLDIAKALNVEDLLTIKKNAQQSVA